MKQRTKLLALLLAIILSLSVLAGCDTNNNETDTSSITTTTEQTQSSDQTTSENTEEETTEQETEHECQVEADPYENISADEFYESYSPACCYQNSVYRTEHNFMSGSLSVPDQAPTISEYQPMVNGLLVRNNEPYYIDKNTYVVVDAYGEEVLRIYRGGAYITLEEVAAYVYAFGNVPANYVSGKNMSPTSSAWGVYLRLNHSRFTGNTQKYPYEPELPNISGCGGDFEYYEIDIGTTGTDSDPGYISRIYNDGQRITRGAARIVYARFDKNGDSFVDPNEKFVFYTYNHYNDFQEYLNYFGGWGEMFGNITGGGKISSKYEYNPTPYVPVYMGSLEDVPTPSSVEIIIYPWIDKKAFELSFVA